MGLQMQQLQHLLTDLMTVPAWGVFEMAVWMQRRVCW
jgi:hypothetical protein